VETLRTGIEAERMLADHWETGCFALDFLRESLATEVEVGPWLAEEQGGVKVREVSLRVPCPPTPMTPESSRGVVRFRVHVDGSKEAAAIRYTATWEMLDVPYADHFRTVQHISLIPSGDGVRARKGFKMEFVKSTFFQSVIEASSKAAAATSAMVFSTFVQQRAKV